MAFTTASLFFFCRSVRNWVPRWAYIPAQLSAPWKETTMVCLLSTRENSPVQSSGVAVPVFRGSGERFENKHHAIRECELNVLWVARCPRIRWHGH
uniref:Secreted protein n=1 Tax=Romanomermis culicivorax TaxID=13658 RepID=A0A915IDJ4_ROMCU